MKKTLKPIGPLLKSSLEIYFKKPNLVYLLKFILVGFLIIVASIIPVAAVGFLVVSLFFALGQALSPAIILLAVLAAFLIVIFVLTVNIWLQVAQIHFINQITTNKILGIKRTLQISWGRKVWTFFAVGFLSIIIVTFGFALLIIPGIIFLVWFSLALFVAVEENKGAIASLARSKELISGHFWPVLGRYLVFLFISAIVQSGVSFIPIAGVIVAIFFGPYFILLPYLVYRDLVRIKGN